MPSSINWSILQPVDVGSTVQQGFATGMALVKGIQAKNALAGYLRNPDSPEAYSALAYLDPQAAQGAEQQHFLRRKMQMAEEEESRRRALGAQYAGGDTQGARSAAVASGDFDLAEQFGKLDESQQKKSAEFWTQAGALAFKLKQTPTPEARVALWNEARPMLEAQGAPAQMLDAFDPLNDTQLEAAITTSQKISDLIDQNRVTWHQQGEQPSFATDFMGRPVGSRNPYAQPAASGDSGGGEPQKAVGGVLSNGGLPGPVVAGFLGNFDVEGGYGGAKGDGGASGGIAQWNEKTSPDRVANFRRIIGKDPAQSTPEEGARFVLWEMQNPEAAGMTVQQRDAILAAPDAATAADLIDRFYARSDGKARSKRVAAALRYAGAPPRITKDQYASLPSGAIFIAADDPTNTPRRKP